MNVLVCALFAFAFAFAFEVSERCAPGAPDAVLCAAHQSEQNGMIARHLPILQSGNVDQRRAALVLLAALNRDHENAPSRAAPRAVAAALDDPDSELRAEALEALLDRQHVDEAVALLDEKLRQLVRRLDRVGKAAYDEVLKPPKDAPRGREEPSAEHLALTRERAFLASGLARLGTVRAEESVIFALGQWKAEHEAVLWSFSGVGPPDPNRFCTPALFSAARELGTRRSAVALLACIDRAEDCRTRHAKLVPKSRPASPQKNGLPDPKSLGDPSDLRLLRLSVRVNVATLELCTSLEDELGRLGRDAGFQPTTPKESGTAVLRAWVTTNLPKSPPTRAPKIAPPKPAK